MEPKALPPAKINPTKLLGGSIFSTKKIDTSNLIDDTVTIRRSGLSIIKGQVIEVKNLIKSSTLLKQAELERKRKEKEKDKFTKKEQELEAKKEEPGVNKVKVPGLPKLGFLDRIKNIIFTVLLGRFIVKMLPNLPKLVGIVKAVSTGVEFAADFAVGLINALGTFIQKADEASIQTRKFLKTVGGDNTVKLFDGFTSAIDKVIEASIIAALAVADLGGGDGKEVSIKRGFDRYGRKVGTEVQERYLQRYGEKQFVERFGQKALQRVATRGAGQTIEKGLLKTLVKRIPIVGGLLDFALNYFVFKEPLGESAFRAAGSTLVSVLGGAIGSIFPGPGTIVGAALGGVAGDALASTLYDMIFKNKVPTQKKVQGRAQGGPVTRGRKLVGGPAKRGVSKTKKRGVTAQPTKLKPGADIGGQKNIEKVFPSPTGKDKDKQVNPLEYIKKSYDRVSKAPFFGPLLSLTTKALSGQKPSQLDYFIAAQGINNWMNITFSSGVLRTGGAFAVGGEANAEMFLKGEDLTQVIAKSLEDNASQQLEGSIQDLMKQMMLKKEEPKTTTPTTVPQGQEGAADFSGSTGEEKTMHYLISQGLTGAQAAGIAGNLQQEGGFNPAADNGTHHGIAQWDKQIRWPRVSAYISSIGMDPNTLEGQLVGLKWEAQQRGNWQKIKQAKSLQEASDIWLKEFEIPGNYAEESPRRAAFGNQLFAKYGNYVPVVGSVPGATLGNIPGNLSAAQQIASSMGLTMTSFNTGRHAKGSLHYQNRAMDFSNGIDTPQQKAFASQIISKYGTSIAELIYTPLGFGIKNGKQVPLSYWGNDTNRQHYNHVHVAFFGGGPTGKGGIVRTHPGEYIIDKDSVDAFGIDFFDIINQTESVAQRKNSAKQLMSILQFYAGYEAGGRQKIKVKVPAPQVSYVPVPVPIGGGMVMTGSSSVDSDYDSTYAGH